MATSGDKGETKWASSAGCKARGTGRDYFGVTGRMEIAVTAQPCPLGSVLHPCSRDATGMGIPGAATCGRVGASTLSARNTSVISLFVGWLKQKSTSLEVFLLHLVFLNTFPKVLKGLRGYFFSPPCAAAAALGRGPAGVAPPGAACHLVTPTASCRDMG